MGFSWLKAHTLFLSGITMLYCLWVHPYVCKNLFITNCLDQARAACGLLSTLGRTCCACQRENNENVSHAGFVAPSNEQNHRTFSDDQLEVDRSSLIESDMDNYAAVYNISNVSYKLKADKFMDEPDGFRDFFDLGLLDDVNLNLDDQSWNMGEVTQNKSIS
ncbi:hypothetical protein TSTA_041470 [Talaromyces stipitatus ATCC 10500]|uniref:Uncharacterized protein n=1 Tax=Talaromyces stipitatus (strain ATCC 10500 / CBS 375.48 / QM 6759 / NRRL 1006) TaxID=441959 RepID=B8MJ80_TALSN|nr:uncharacterized protein TSTA_041470 [Talaromyces stipitatus ATCC 10500]EED14669.1 hypothetical protein TSTA_041470 [Talaromyces stipitatus ATCC 10500]